jgi:methionyl-tRNA formyltransferase
MDKLSIVFMGTPEFAVGILEEILKHPKIEVKAVVTMPDKASGRGQKVHESAVKQFAVAQHIPVLQPEKLRSPEFITQLQGINADCFVVVAFRMLPEMVWAMPQKGTLNLHASLLPQYRGAAPINWVIINGEKETGVTTFFIEKEIDTGSIILQEKVTISEVMTAGELHDELKSIGAKW